MVLSSKKSSSKTSHLKSVTYDVHDNGGRPFRVVIKGKDIKIYKARESCWIKQT